MSAQGFEYALHRLVTDKDFADRAAADETVLTDIYVLTDEEKQVLTKIFQTVNPAGGAAVVVACYVACNATQ